MYFIIFSLSFQYGAKIKRILSTRATNGRPYDCIPPLLSVSPLHPSVDFVDSSPLWEPYMPLLEERCPKGGVVVSYRTAPRRHFSALPWATDGRPYNRIPPLLSVFPRHPQSTLSTAPLYGSLICLSLRRGARRAEWWFSTRRHLDVTFQHYHRRPMVAPTHTKREAIDFSF